MTSILTGADDIVERHLGIGHIGTTQPRSVHRTSCAYLNNARPANFHPEALVGELLDQIDGNWLKAGRQRHSSENWRFQKRLQIAAHNQSREKQLEKAIARVMPDTWANQVPTSSGLTGSGERHRNLDLVCQPAPGSFELIELKFDSGNPLHAAMEVLQYGILYLFYRLRLRMPGESRILDADTVHLRVLAPPPFYAGYHFGWLEKDLTCGLAAVITKRLDASLNMDFDFVAFPTGFVWPCLDAPLIEAVTARAPVQWSDAKSVEFNNTSSQATVACRSALRLGFLRSAPQMALDDKGYVAETRHNLIEGVHLEDFEADLRQGDGNELEVKFRAAHSSSALTVNTFAPFKSNSSALRLAGLTGFTDLCFERKCSHGLIGSRSPNLDVVADGAQGVLAIESKCLEHLNRHEATFSPAYNAEIRDKRRRTSWFREMLRLIEEPDAYQWLDAAQLVKHAFGLAHTFPDRTVKLVYLFWEPSNPEAFPGFAEHRAEVDRFAASIAGNGPEFIAMSYPELWRLWETHPGPEWLSHHVPRLRARYEVAV